MTQYGPGNQLRRGVLRRLTDSHGDSHISHRNGSLPGFIPPSQGPKPNITLLLSDGASISFLSMETLLQLPGA
jgi:hypothetical protein